jgi:hypothetical protein
MCGQPRTEVTAGLRLGSAGQENHGDVGATRAELPDDVHRCGTPFQDEKGMAGGVGMFEDHPRVAAHVRRISYPGECLLEVPSGLGVARRN